MGLWEGGPKSIEPDSNGALLGMLVYLAVLRPEPE